jgi:hypothetical protein
VHSARQIVWQLLEIPLHYLQIDALRKRVAAAVLAEKRCGREPDGQSGALTCARIANELPRGPERVADGGRSNWFRKCILDLVLAPSLPACTLRHGTAVLNRICLGTVMPLSIVRYSPDRLHEFSHRAACRGYPIRCRHRTTPARAFRLSGSQTRTAFH